MHLSLCRQRAASELRTFAMAGLLAAALAPSLACAAPLLRCQIDHAGKTYLLDFPPVSDPYTVAAVDINERFSFKAVVIGDAHHVEYIKLYTYSQLRRQPMLMHEAKYLAPVPATGPAPVSLTGLNFIYSPRLERELQYSCTLLEVVS